jgi:hypothetical protein
MLPNDPPKKYYDDVDRLPDDQLKPITLYAKQRLKEYTKHIKDYKKRKKDFDEAIKYIQDNDIKSPIEGEYQDIHYDIYKKFGPGSNSDLLEMLEKSPLNAREGFKRLMNVVADNGRAKNSTDTSFQV